MWNDSPGLDLSDSDYIPVPEWYFNSHFEILRITPPSLYVAATFVLPSLVGLVLVLLLWLDRGRSSVMADRKPIILAGSVCIVLVIVLTIVGVVRSASHGDSGLDAGIAAVDGGEDPRIALGRDVFEEEYCSTCHRIDGEGETKGPDLSHIRSHLQEGYLREWVTDPEAFRPETIMPAVQANGKKLDDLVFYLMSLE